MFTDFAGIPPEHRTIGWLVFCRPGARELYVDWEFKARETVAYLRTEAGKRPHATCRLACPALGTILELSWKTFQMTADPDEILVVYSVAEDSPSAVALRRLTCDEADARTLPPVAGSP